MEYDNPWTYEGKVFYSEHIDKNIGFVYRITNLTNGRRYIGKKLFYFTKTKQVKKKKKRFLVESDWKEYYGSNKELQEDVNLLGVNNFKREILVLCNAKGEMSYMEAKIQFDLDVLKSVMYYNSIIQCRIHKRHLKG